MRVISQLIGFDEFKAFCKARSTDSWQFSKKVTHGLAGSNRQAGGLVVPQNFPGQGIRVREGVIAGLRASSGSGIFVIEEKLRFEANPDEVLHWREGSRRFLLSNGARPLPFVGAVVDQAFGAHARE